MRWTYEHIYLGREILLIKPYQYKPASKGSGNAWSSIAEDLNKISEVYFDVNQKAVRDRCRNLLEKQKKVRREEGNLAPRRKILNLIISEAVVRRCSVKKLFLEISQNSQENTCASGLQLY